MLPLLLMELQFLYLIDLLDVLIYLCPQPLLLFRGISLESIESKGLKEAIDLITVQL